MQQATKIRVLGFVAPFFRGVALIATTAYNTFFAWWLDPWLQRKANRALLDDVYANFYFLVSHGSAEASSSGAVLPFDYSLVQIRWRNLVFFITRGRGDVSVTVAPRHESGKSYELGLAVAALEGRHFSERDVINDLSGAADILRPRLEALNAAFSEQDFRSIEQRL